MQFIREYQLSDTGICDALIRCFEECRSRDVVHRGRLGMHDVRLELKDSYDLTLSNIPPAVRDAYADVFEAYFAALGEFATDYMDNFPHLRSHTRPCSINEPPNIQHYPPKGGFFEEHYENAGPMVARRVLTFQSYLNDIEEGGGTRFVYQDYVTKPGKGKTVLPFERIQALGVGATRDLGEKPVVLIDLILNWGAAPGQPLHILRIRSDRFDPRSLVPCDEPGVPALRAFVVALVEQSSPVCLPDEAAVRGEPFSVHPTVDDHERATTG